MVSSVIYVFNTPIGLENMHEFWLYIVHCIIKLLLNVELSRSLSRAFSSIDTSYLGVDNCAYHKTLLPNDASQIYMLFIIKAYNLFLIG